MDITNRQDQDYWSCFSHCVLIVCTFFLFYKAYARALSDKLAPISLRECKSSAFYSHSTWTSAMFVKKRMKMNSVLFSFQGSGFSSLLFYIFFFCISITHPKKIFYWNVVTTKFAYIIMNVNPSIMVFLLKWGKLTIFS